MQQRSEQTKHKILLSAIQLFAEHGYEATGVAEICKLAGISKGAFYHHFPSKQVLFLVLLEDWISRLEDKFTTIQQQSSDVPNAVLQMVDSVIQTIKDTDTQLALLLEFWTQAHRDPEIWQVAIDPYRRFHEYFTRLVNKGMQEKSIREMDPRVGGNVIVSLALGLLLQRFFYPDSRDWETEMRESVALILDGMAWREN